VSYLLQHPIRAGAILPDRVLDPGKQLHRNQISVSGLPPDIVTNDPCRQGFQ
jgi:hypothetical protein